MFHTALKAGEKLTPLPTMPDAYVLLVKPPVSVSTGLIYEEIDGAPLTVRPDTDAVIDAIEKQNIECVANNLCNVMESVTAKMHPMVGGIKQKMLLNGALGAVMSGSGPTVFGLFDDFQKAKASADSFSLQFRDVYLTRIQN